MHAFDEDHVTVDEAATILRVAPSTVRRWIRAGEVPAYRIGRRRMALRRGELTALVTPIHGTPESAGDENRREEIRHRKLTPEEIQRGLEAMDRLQQWREEIYERRGGEPFRSSLEIIHEMREERTRELM